MAEVNQPGSPTPSAAPAAPATPAAPQPQGLEKVYSDFGIEDTASQFQPQSPQPAPQTPQPATPSVKFDPFDPNFPAHMERVSKAAVDAQTALNQTQGQVTALQRQLHSQKVEADIKSAVDVISKQAGIEPEIAEVALEAKARQDPRFRSVWENRAKNPKAWAAAQTAFATEAQQKFTVRQDPQLAENQRAMRTSQQAMATTQKASDQDRWASMSPQERAVERERIKKFG